MLAALDLATGMLHYGSAAEALVEFLDLLETLRARWPDEKLYVVCDNLWPTRCVLILRKERARPARRRVRQPHDEVAAVLCGQPGDEASDLRSRLRRVRAVIKDARTPSRAAVRTVRSRWPRRLWWGTPTRPSRPGRGGPPVRTERRDNAQAAATLAPGDRPEWEYQLGAVVGHGDRQSACPVPQRQSQVVPRGGNGADPGPTHDSSFLEGLGGAPDRPRQPSHH
jgi:hypothetical protein